jgi:predicted RNase H-like HicB family nuclease
LPLRNDVNRAPGKVESKPAHHVAEDRAGLSRRWLLLGKPQREYDGKNEISRGDEYYVAECFDLPVVTQDATLYELMKNVKEAIALQLEGKNPADFGLAPRQALRYIPSEELAPHFYAD